MEKTVRARHHGNAMRALHISEERMGDGKRKNSNVFSCARVRVYVCVCVCQARVF